MTRFPPIAILLLSVSLGIGGPAWAQIDCKPIRVEIPATAEPPLAKNVKIEADEIDFPKRNLVHLRGFTQLVRGGHRVYADELIYDKTRNLVEAHGVVKFESHEGDVVVTSFLQYDINKDQIESGPATFQIVDRKTTVLGSGQSMINAHGTAERVIFEKEDVLFLEQASVITCLDGEQDITFTADGLRVDLNEGIRTASRVKIRIEKPKRHERLKVLIE